MLGQALRFGMVGLVNTTVSLLVIYALMYFFAKGVLVANLIGYFVGIVIGFSLNRNWTFSDKGALKNSVPRYALVLGVAYLANLIVVAGGLAIFRANPYALQPLGMFVYTGFNFFGCRYYVFALSSSTPPEELDPRAQVQFGGNG
jgi:putative flippase GtrA